MVPTNIMLEHVETLSFAFPDFATKSHTRGQWISYPGLEAHGYEWHLDVYPKGSDTSTLRQENISCYVRVADAESVTAFCSFRCKRFERTCAQPALLNPSWGFSEFFSRGSIIANYLNDDGSLVIEVDIQIATEDKRVWYPLKDENDFLAKLYREKSYETTDVAFSVGGTVYRAHKYVLSVEAKYLYEASRVNDSKDTPIPIQDVRGEIFQDVLEFAYSVKTPAIENKDVAIEILVAADRFECIKLKLYAESILVDKFLTAGNAAELLLFADSYSCALLKEAAMGLFAENKEAVKSSEAWPGVQGSSRLLEELLDRVACSHQRLKLQLCGKRCRDSNIDCLDVTPLRRELEMENLELDGSREVLVDRLRKRRQG